MYIVLIEAGGLRQMARIHAAWHRSFLQDLDQVMTRSAFRREQQDGDLLYYALGAGAEIDSLILADSMRGLLSFLRAHAENLLDFVVVLGYYPRDDLRSGIRDLGRLLRQVRDTNNVYITEAALGALEPEVETSSAGVLFCVVSFHGDRSVQVPAYRDVLCSNDDRALLEHELASGTDRRDIWVQGADRARTTVTVQAALEKNGVPPVTIQCRPGMTRSEFERTLIRDLPDVPAFSSSGLEEEFEQALMVLRKLLRDPAGMYLSAGWVEGDISLVASHVIQRYLQSESQRLLYLADYDLCGPDVPDLPWWIPDATTVGPLVVSGRSGAPDDRWRGVRFTEEAQWYSPFGSALRYWYARGEGEEPNPYPEITDAATSLVRTLNINHRRLLYLLVRTQDLLDPAVMVRHLTSLGITPAESSRVLSDLSRMGLITNREPLRVNVITEELIDHLLPAAEREKLDGELSLFILGEVRAGAIYPAPGLWPLVRNVMATPEGRWYYHEMIHGLAVGGGDLEPDKLLAKYDAHDRFPTETGSGRIRLYIRDSRGPDNCREEAHMLAASVATNDESQDPAAGYLGDYALSLAEYHLARRDYTDALAYSKKAIIAEQNVTVADGFESNRRGAGQLLMARIFLSQRRLRDASHYLDFAREESRQDPATLLIARMLKAIRLFLGGNLTRAAGELRKLVTPLLENGFTEWLILNWFATGRISFELGEYSSAREEFSLVSRYCEGSGNPAPAQVATAWSARADLQLDPHDQFARNALTGNGETPESLLFRGEAFCRTGDFAEALPLLEQACEMEARCDRWPRLGVCWDNGFASIEDLIIAHGPGTSELLRIATAYRAWALAETGNMDQAVPIFFDLTRGNEEIGEDPYAGLFNYLYSGILPRERYSDRDDAVTVLGKSVKIVQERTSRIDDYHDKMRFLKGNVWNRSLMEAARACNLV